MKNDLIAVPGVCLANSSFLRDFFKLHAVPVHLETTVQKINDHSVIVKHKDNSIEEIPCDSVIMSIGYNPDPLIKNRKCPLVGDCKHVGNLRNVIWNAWDVAMKL